MNKNDKERVQQFIQKRKIESLYHFTDIQNLGYILLSKDIGGLRTIDNLQDYKKKHKDFYYSKNDLTRHKYNNGICLSISRINSRLLYRYRQRYQDRTYIIIEIEPKVIVEKYCSFFTTNSSTCTIQGNHSDHYSNFDSFYLLFKPEEYYVENQYSSFLYKYDQTIDDQAEVICFQNIEINYIKKIYYKEEDDKIVKIKSRCLDIPFIQKNY